MGYAYSLFKSYTIQEDVSCKNSGLWEIELNDHRDADYVYSSVLYKIDDFLEANQLEPISNLFWTVYETYDFFERNGSKEDAAKNASRFVPPDKCLAFVKENHVIELLKKHKPEDYEDMIQQLRVLIGYWEQGYYVYSWY